MIGTLFISILLPSKSSTTLTTIRYSHQNNTQYEVTLVWTPSRQNNTKDTKAGNTKGRMENVCSVLYDICRYLMFD